MTAKKTTPADTTTTDPATDTVTDTAGIVTSRNDNASDPTGVNPAATWETSTTPTLTVDTVRAAAEVRYPIQCLAPMPCTCPKCIGVGTDENTLSAEEAADAADKTDTTGVHTIETPIDRTDEETPAADNPDDKPAK
jgi:hypothetical protein